MRALLASQFFFIFSIGIVVGWLSVSKWASACACDQVPSALSPQDGFPCPDSEKFAQDLSKNEKQLAIALQAKAEAELQVTILRQRLEEADEAVTERSKVKKDFAASEAQTELMAASETQTEAKTQSMETSETQIDVKTELLAASETQTEAKAEVMAASETQTEAPTALGQTKEKARARHKTAESQLLHFLSRLPPIPCREDLSRIAQHYFFKTGRAVEIGVFQGSFARHNLREWKGKYFAIDAWQFRPHDPLDKNYLDEKENNRNYEATKQKLAEFGERAVQMKKLSQDAAKVFDDHSFDWIYIDALHTFQAVKKDLHLWWPKLRSGGLLSGDDYGDYRKTQMMIPERWAAAYGNVAVEHNWGVISALEEFAAEVGGVVQVTWQRQISEKSLKTYKVNKSKGVKFPQCYLYPAWYMVKPR